VHEVASRARKDSESSSSAKVPSLNGRFRTRRTVAFQQLDALLRVTTLAPLSSSSASASPAQQPGGAPRMKEAYAWAVHQQMTIHHGRKSRYSPPASKNRGYEDGIST